MELEYRSPPEELDFVPLLRVLASGLESQSVARPSQRQRCLPYDHYCRLTA